MIQRKGNKKRLQLKEFTKINKSSSLYPIDTTTYKIEKVNPIKVESGQEENLQAN